MGESNQVRLTFNFILQTNVLSLYSPRLPLFISSLKTYLGTMFLCESRTQKKGILTTLIVVVIVETHWGTAGAAILRTVASGYTNTALLR